MKNGTRYITDPATAPAVYRRRERQRLAGLAAGGDAPRPPRRPANPARATGAKQTGRRSGPPPAFEPTPSAAPMSDAQRAAMYGISIVTVLDEYGEVVHRPLGGTAQQRRQWTRMHRRNLALDVGR